MKSKRIKFLAKSIVSLVAAGAFSYGASVNADATDVEATEDDVLTKIAPYGN